MVQGKELQYFGSWSFSTEGTTHIPREAITLRIGPHSNIFFTHLQWTDSDTISNFLP